MRHAIVRHIQIALWQGGGKRELGGIGVGGEWRNLLECIGVGGGVQKVGGWVVGVKVSGNVVEQGRRVWREGFHCY